MCLDETDAGMTREGAGWSRLYDELSVLGICRFLVVVVVWIGGGGCNCEGKAVTKRVSGEREKWCNLSGCGVRETGDLKPED